MKISHNISFPEVEGIEFYAVGGCVRDLIMGRKPNDYDFVMLTSLSYDRVIKRLRKSGITIFQEKPEFQTIVAGISDPENPKAKLGVDFAFPRAGGRYTDGRRPDVTRRTNDLRKDAARRDFTINSMFMDRDGEIIDHFNGIKDIANFTIRAVGNPNERFDEDALRILRAMRFACQLNFIIERSTRDAMNHNFALLYRDSIVMDRIREELNKMLALNPVKAMSYILDYDINALLNYKDGGHKFELKQSAQSYTKTSINHMV